MGQNIKIVKIYKEKKSKAKKAVAMAKGHAYEDLYARLETKGVVQLARQRESRERCTTRESFEE